MKRLFGKDKPKITKRTPASREILSSPGKAPILEDQPQYPHAHHQNQTAREAVLQQQQSMGYSSSDEHCEIVAPYQQPQPLETKLQSPRAPAVSQSSSLPSLPGLPPEASSRSASLLTISSNGTTREIRSGKSRQGEMDAVLMKRPHISALALGLLRASDPFATLVAPIDKEHRGHRLHDRHHSNEALRSAISILCKEMRKPPPQLSGSTSGLKEWELVEMKLQPLARLERIWGKSGGTFGGSLSHINAQGGSNGLTSSGEDRERRYFSEALRDGFVLCQLVNKLRPGTITRVDPRDDGRTRTSNVIRFLASCSQQGVPADELFLRDDLLESNPESLARVARTIICVVKVLESPVVDRSKVLSGQGKKLGGSDTRSGPYGYGTSSRAAFPRSVSGDASPAPSSDGLTGADISSNEKPRLPRGRFQSEIEGMSASRRAYDELGQRPHRARFESMVDLGVASSNASASDLLSRDSLDGSLVRKALVVREEGKPPTRFQLGNGIGRGQFGSVYRALNLNTGQMVAVKQIRLEGLEEDEVTKLMREIDLLKSLSHPGIVKYEGMARDHDTLSIVLEYVENGSLGQIFKAFGKLNESLVAGYVVKILEGLHYLHESDVVHCALKAANILTTKNGNVKLSDFGVSINLRTVEREMKDVGTLNWMAPEVIELRGASTKADIWSLGCTVIELLTGRPPYAEIANGFSVMLRIVEDDMPPIPEGSSAALQDFLQQCFNKDPTLRPSAEILCKHEWLNKSLNALKDLRRWDSIPFLRRASIDFQKSEKGNPTSVFATSVDVLKGTRGHTPTSPPSETAYETSFSKPPSQVPNKLHKFLVALLSNRISDLECPNSHAEAQRNGLQDDLQRIVERIKFTDNVMNLVESQQSRVELMTCARNLGCQNHSSVREALLKDDEEITSLLRTIVTSPADRNVVLSLRGDTAEKFLTVAYRILEQEDPTPNDDPGNRIAIHRVVMKLCQRCGMLPPSLNVTGITGCSKEPLAGGGFADIFRASYQAKAVALKRLREFQVGPEREKIRKRFCREALIWQSLNHPHVLPFIGIDLQSFLPKMCMVSPWMQQGTILSHIKSLGGSSNVNIDQHLLEISQGLQYLHFNNVIHGDLRGSNIFVDEDWHVRLADFGLADWADTTLTTNTNNHAGSIRWMAPELHNYEASVRRTAASDTYSFAFVCIELYTGECPFAGTRMDHAVMMRVLQGERPSRVISVDDSGLSMSDDLWDLLRRCWSQEPSNRPPMYQVAELMKGFQQDTPSILQGHP